MRRRRFPSLLFPLILSLLLGGISFWLYRSTEVRQTEIKLDPEQPQYTMNGVEARQFDTEGRLWRLLTAAEARQMPESSDIIFRQPEITVWENGKLSHRLNARTGVYHRNGKRLDLNEEVILIRYNERGEETARLESPSLRLDEPGQSIDTLTELTPASARVKTVIYHVQKTQKP